MKITIANLRKLIREELANAVHAELGSTDGDLSIGRAVGIVGANQPLKGKVTGRHSGSQGTGSVWTVVTKGGQTLQKRSEDLKAVDKKEPGEVEKVAKEAPEEPKDDDEGVNVNNLILDKELHEAPLGFASVGNDAAHGNAEKTEELFNEKHYEFIARQLMMKWTDRDPETSWKAVADNYVRATKASTGKVLNSEELYTQLQKVVDEQEDNERSGYHQQPSRSGKR